jgi:tRNA pseudouridine38-40 synthase
MVAMDMLSRECRNIKLVLSYDGHNYEGWQRQKRTRNTIQEILENTLSSILNEKVHVIGAGRTDSGAHALRQVANFKTSNFSIPAHKFKIILNNSLPGDIRIISSEEVSTSFHSRFSASYRKYIYLLYSLNQESSDIVLPFISRYSMISKESYDVSLLSKMIKKFVGLHDFGFISSKREYKTTTRFVKTARVFKYRGFVVFSVKANGFLYNMMRGIVSCTLEAYRLGDIEIIDKFLSGSVKNKPTLVPPNGLFLHRVYY